MTAKQFLRTESTYCRQRAEACADRFIAEELRRLADCFEKTAIAQPEPTAPQMHQSNGVSTGHHRQAKDALLGG